MSNLKEAIEPDFSSIKVGSRILMKLKPPDNEVIVVSDIQCIVDQNNLYEAIKKYKNSI